MELLFENRIETNKGEIRGRLHLQVLSYSLLIIHQNDDFHDDHFSVKMGNYSEFGRLWMDLLEGLPALKI